MKRSALLWLAACALAQQPATIEWAKDFDTAMKQSREDGQPVLAYFTFET